MSQTSANNNGEAYIHGTVGGRGGDNCCCEASFSLYIVTGLSGSIASADKLSEGWLGCGERVLCAARQGEIM